MDYKDAKHYTLTRTGECCGVKGWYCQEDGGVCCFLSFSELGPHRVLAAGVRVSIPIKPMENPYATI